MSAFGKNDERLLGKLLVSTALVVISAGYGYWQKTHEVPRPVRSAAAAPSPLPAKVAAPAPDVTAPAVTASDPAPLSSGAAADTAAPAHANVRTALADKVAAPTEAVVPAPAAAPVVPEGPAATAITTAPGMRLEDGTYVSREQDFEWGAIQVKVVIKDSAFTDVKMLQMPDERPHSGDLSDMSEPILIHEAIHDQKSEVDLVSSATATSMAYRDALADVITQAMRLAPRL